MPSKIQITASQLGRTLTCPASLVLPSAKSNESNEAAYRGTIIHSYLEDYIHLGKEQALKNIPIQDDEYRLTCESINMDEILKGSNVIQTEVGFKYNIEKQTAVTIQNYRDKKNDEETNEVALIYDKNNVSKEITGIADIITISQNGEYTILDYKTGFERVSAINNPQLSFFAMCVALINKPSKITIGIVTVLENGQAKIEKQEISQDYIKAFQGKLLTAYNQVVESKLLVEKGINPDVVTSDYCKYCPAINSCPAKNKLALAMSNSTSLENILKIESLSISEIGDVWEKLKQAKKIIEIVEENIKDIVKKEVIPLPSGKCLAQFLIEKETIEAEVAEKIIRQELGDEIANKVVEKKITKTKLRTLVPDKKIYDAIIDKLSKSKALKLSTYTQIKEGNVKK